jgi:hypothetical protein
MEITQDAAPAARPVQVVDVGALLRLFDGKMHRRMDFAKTPEAWTEVQSILTNAYKHHNLRGNLRERFLKDCPHPALVVAFRETVGLKPARKPVVEVDESTLFRRFDGKTYSMMTLAKTEADWLAVYTRIMNACKEDNLRHGVMKRFLAEEGCPKRFKTNLQMATGTLPKPVKRGVPVQLGDRV